MAEAVLRAVSVEALSIRDLDRVAAIHCTAFPESFLSSLGQSTVRRYYHWLLTGPHDVTAIGVRNDQELVGFAVGGVFRGALSGFIKHNWLALACSVSLRPWLLVRRNNRHRVVSGVRTFVPFLRCEARNGGLPSSAKNIGIMAIAVDPNHGRSGYGQRLMTAFEQAARDGKFSAMHLRVNPANTAAIAFYHKLGWSKHDDPWSGVMFKRVSEN